MPLTEKKWWRKVVGHPVPEKKVEISKDLAAILEFLQDLPKNQKILLPELKKLEELEKESHVAKVGLLHVNLETQSKVLEKIIDAYESLQNDTDINGLRLKRIVHEFLARAQRAGMKDLVQQKREDQKWQCKW